MKKFFIAGICALMVVGATAQTSSKATSKPAGLGKPEAAVNEETNIRAYIELLRTDVKKAKSEVMAMVMQLDAGDAAKFWPIYKEFETEYSTLGDRVVSVVREYADKYDSLTDDVADKLANQVLAIEQQRNVLKKKYYDRVKESLGAITATRFLQVENQLERLIDLQVAAQLPVAGGQ
jgi:hypothetical protein